MTVTLPSITGTLSIEDTPSGHVVTVSITPSPSNRSWSASTKFVTLPAASTLDLAGKRLLVAAVQSWLSEAAEVYPVIS